MADRTCAVCLQPMPLTSRSDATMCSNACRAWRRRHPDTPRPLGPQTYVCGHCSAQFVRPKAHSGKRPRFCTDRCWEAYRHRQRPFGEWRVPDPYPPRPFVCQDCAADGMDSGTGPIAVRCEPCAANRQVMQGTAWRRANPDRSRAIGARWLRANPDYLRRYWDLNRATLQARQRRYEADNVDRVRAWKRDRQNRRRAILAAVTVEPIKSSEVYERDRWICGICWAPVDPSVRHPDPASPSLDHVIPLSRGGAHALSNVQLAHLHCNIAKGASLP